MFSCDVSGLSWNDDIIKGDESLELFFHPPK